VTSTAERERWRSERLRALRVRVDFLEGERARLEALLGDALELAAVLAVEQGYATTPVALLEMLAARRGFNLATPAFVEKEAAA
jgi:hypothetical protein